MNYNFRDLIINKSNYKIAPIFEFSEIKKTSIDISKIKLLVRLDNPKALNYWKINGIFLAVWRDTIKTFKSINSK